jgi:predicted dehydrogenase
MVKAGLIGAGGIGEAHSSAYALIPEVQVCAVVDVRPERANFIAEKHNARSYTSLGEMLAKEQLDMVDICTPSYLHVEHVQRCIENGLNVLCEKPIAFYLNDAKAIIAEAIDKRVKFMIAQVIRFWPEYAILRQAVVEGRYGQLLQVSFQRTCGAPIWAWEGWYVDPQRSKMAPYELGIHDIDFLNYLLGKPAEVHAEGIERPEITLSRLNAHFQYVNGPQVDVEAAWYAGEVPFMATYRAVFEDALLDYRPDGLWLYRKDHAKGEKLEIPAGVVIGSNINLENAGPIYNEIAYFVNCLCNDCYPDILTPHDSLVSLRMLLAALDARQTGETVKI